MKYVDPYHVFTARLAALGHQRTTMRVVAGCILSLSIPAVLAASSTVAASWPGGRIVFAVGAAVCVALAVPWLRYRWPTRAESAASVVLGTLILAAGCSVTSDPLAGLLITVAFPFLLGYTAVFHNARLLGFVVVAAGATIGVLTVRVALYDVAEAASVVTPLALLCTFVTFGARTVAKVGGGEQVREDLEPLTGLLTRESFYEGAASLLAARNRDDDRHLVVLALSIDALAAVSGVQGQRGAHQALVSVGQALRETVRHDAVLAHVGEGEFLIADTFTVPDPAPLVERLLGAVSGTPSGITASIGVVSAPLGPLTVLVPHGVIDEALGVATAAMAEARRGGGNQARYVLDPDLGTD